MNANPRLYVASRASVPERAAMWRRLRDCEGWNIISSWIDEDRPGQTACFTELWSRIEREIAECDGLVLFAHANDFPLKGAFVEAGMAIGLGKPAAIVMEAICLEGQTCRPIGSWIKHPACVVAQSLEEAKGIIAQHECS